MGPTALFDIIHDPTVLFQLTFTFIYSTFSNNFSVSAKKAVSKHTLSKLASQALEARVLIADLDYFPHET